MSNTMSVADLERREAQRRSGFRLHMVRTIDTQMEGPIAIDVYYPELARDGEALDQLEPLYHRWQRVMTSQERGLAVVGWDLKPHSDGVRWRDGRPMHAEGFQDL